MSGAARVVLALAVLAALVVLVLGVGAVALGVGKYNTLVALHERANEGRSRFAAAVNTASEKMKSVWTLAEQEGILEKETYLGVAKARAGYLEARQAYEAAAADPASSIADVMTRGAALGQSLVNVRVAFEAYPQLRTAETYQKAMVAVQEGFNEIKTALDDWIAVCRAYNTERRSFPTSWFAGAFFGPDFPERIAYYEGGIKEPEQVRVKTEDISPGPRKP
ncbi:MAG: LemA family protein [Planctomycetes bacterium]|nr:LemA family protein [Planctomycetota bacterium]